MISWIKLDNYEFVNIQAYKNNFIDLYFTIFSKIFYNVSSTK